MKIITFSFRYLQIKILYPSSQIKSEIICAMKQDSHSKFISDEFNTFLEFYQGKNYLQTLPISAVSLPGYGGCIIANQDVKAGQELLSIPESMFISMTTALNNDNQLREVSKKLICQKKSILAFYLNQQLSDNSSTFYSYLQSLPKQYSNPITWNKDQMNLIRQELREKYQKKQIRLSSEFEEIKQRLVQLKQLEIENLENIDFNTMKINKKEEERQEDKDKIIQQLLNIQLVEEEQNISTKQSENIKIKKQQLLEHLNEFQLPMFLQLTAMIESRTLFYKNKEDPTSEVGAMVPFYDLANHTFMENTDHFKLFCFDEKRRCYLLNAYQDLQAGEQVFITYGNYCNEHFLEHYGFMCNDNSREAISFTIKLNQFLRILGQKGQKMLQNNYFLICHILSHLCSQNHLKDQIIIEIEQNSKQFSWQTLTLLKLLSLQLDNKDIPIKPKEKEIKQQQKNKKKVDDGRSNEKKLLAEVMESVSSDSIEQLACFNSDLYSAFKQSLKQYLLSIFKQEIQELNNLSMLVQQQEDFISSLASKFTLQEISIVSNCII